MKKLVTLFYGMVLLSLPQTIMAQEVDFKWAKSAGGSNDDTGNRIAVDDLGNTYITGYFREIATFGDISLTSQGENDIFIVKLDPNGDFEWVKSAGGENEDFARDIAVDNQGNVYVTGSFSGTATFSSTSVMSVGGSDIFIAKLDTNGNFIWVKNYGSDDDDTGNSIEFDNLGNAYITGGFSGEINFGNTTLSSNGLNDVLIAKIDANGDFLWAKSAGGSSGGDFGLDITVDGQGNSYVTGRFVGMVSFGTFTLTSNGITDVFIAKLDSNGEFLWAKGAGGTGPDIGNGIAVDSQGNSYIVGYFGFSISFGDFDLISNGMWDVFVTKLDTYGNFLWAKSAGGNDFDEGYGIDLDIQGNPYITGVICGTITIGNTSLSGLCDAFISKLNSNGEFLWTKRASGLSMVGYGLAIDNQGYSYVTGRFSGTASFDNITLTAIGDNDIFIAKLNKDTLSVIENSDVTLQIYPNPANNQISINSNSNSQIGQVEIYNLLGAKVDEVAVNNHEAVIDVSTLKAGTYFFKIYADSGVSTKKISKR